MRFHLGDTSARKISDPRVKMQIVVYIQLWRHCYDNVSDMCQGKCEVQECAGCKIDERLIDADWDWLKKAIDPFP
jgi:hypothetical protein